MEDHRKLNTELLQKKKMKLSLEDYLDFISSNKQNFLPAKSLNQIIRMHGYMNIKGQKNVLKDAVKTIDLISLSRSTLKESISSSASIPLEDVISDLKNLDWQECCVTSLLTFSSWKPNNSDSSLDHQKPTCASKKSKKKLRLLVECKDEQIQAIDGVSPSSASKNPGSELEPQRKRRKPAISSGEKNGSPHFT